MKVGKEFTFDCAHRLPFHKGQCKNLHGHTYKVIVEVEQPDNEVQRILIDFGDLKKEVKAVLDLYDHSLLLGGTDAQDGELISLLKSRGWKYYIFEFDTTVENLSKHIGGLIKSRLQSTGNHLDKLNFGLTIKMYETPTSYAEVTIK